MSLYQLEFIANVIVCNVYYTGNVNVMLFVGIQQKKIITRKSKRKTKQNRTSTK